MLRVGLTGGIGSGKSTVAAIFENLGIPVAYADLEAKKLMNEDAGLREAIIRHFGAALTMAPNSTVNTWRNVGSTTPGNLNCSTAWSIP